MKVSRILLLTNYTPDLVELSFKDPASQNPFQVTFTSGLGAPEDIDWGSTPAGYEAKLPPRDVVIRLGLNPDWGSGEDYSILRTRLARMIHATRSGNIVIGLADDEEVIAALQGRIVKMEVDPHSKTPDVEFTINCKDGMLRGLELTEVPLAGLSPIETVITDDLSTAPHGALLAVKFNAPATTFSFTGGEDEEPWVFQTTPIGTTFLVNDILICSSMHNDRQLVIQRGATAIPIADSIHAGSDWPVIFPRPNTIVCSGDVSWHAIKYATAYWGI